MKLHRHHLLLVLGALFVVAAAADPVPETTTTTTTTVATPTTTEDEFGRCNCDDHCLESKVIGLKKNATSAEPVENKLLREDVDKDGNRTICARNRDLRYRSFPSVCHMMCYNNCTVYRVRKSLINDVMVTFLGAVRENFYKLRDGPC